MKPQEILRAMADTYEERNAVYKNNYLVVGSVMTALFPDGVELKTEHDYVIWHLFELIIVKLTRFTETGLKHTDSIHDIAVYCAMLESLIKENDDEK